MGRPYCWASQLTNYIDQYKFKSSVGWAQVYVISFESANETWVESITTNSSVQEDKKWLLICVFILSSKQQNKSKTIITYWMAI